MSELIFPSRLPDWRPRLAAYMQRVARLPFRPGRNDCALFAAGAVEAMTGVDLAAGWRGTYRHLADGQAALLAAGYRDHFDLIEQHFQEVAPAFSKIGDLAVFPCEGQGQALGVVQGGGVYVLSPGGLAVANRLRMVRAYAT